jgi:hypothetical protein
LPAFFINNTNATFNIPLTIQPEWVLGPSEVTVTLTCDNTYYLGSSNKTTVVVRDHTKLDMWLDQNNNGERNNPSTYITCVKYVDESGNVHDWNIAHIKGRLTDVEISSERSQKGVANQKVSVWWAYNQPWQKYYETTTNEYGEFAVDVPIEYGHPLGPVEVTAVFSENPASCYYDPSNYYDRSGDPFSVVAMTHFVIEQSTPAVKGENVLVKGKLLDDRDAAVKNRTVKLYWLGTAKEKTNYDKNRNQLGTMMGMVVTDDNGYFRFTDYVIPRIQNVGTAYVVATYGGSQLWPNGLAGQKYGPSDAYSKSWSKAIEYGVTAYTFVEVDNWNMMKMTRYNLFSIKGRVWEFYQKEVQQQLAVKNEEVVAYIQDAKGNEYFFGKQRTLNENLDTDGSFQLTGTVPREVLRGAGHVRVQFNGTAKYLPSDNLSKCEIWADTEIKLSEFPYDTNSDGRVDINQGDIDLTHPLRITVKLYEANTPSEVEPIPIDYEQGGVVWLNLSAVTIVRENMTMRKTDPNGRAWFNFTKPLRDTNYGTLFINKDETRRSQDITVNITYTGGRYLNPATLTRDATVNPPPPPPVVPWTEKTVMGVSLLQLLLFMIIMIILFAIALFFAVRWLKKRARIRGMKRIIKRAADQLVAGNEYTAVIFKSYQKLGAHLRKYGYLRRDSETFREFEDAVRSALPIDRVSMNEFLKLLEEARYSHHKIGEAQRNQAIMNLRNIEASLERIILDESAAMKALEAMEEAEVVDTDIVVAHDMSGPSGPSGPRPR